MYIRNGLRWNIHASVKLDGVRYHNTVDPAVQAALGITEIADPQPPEDYSDETYYRTEQDEAPYVIYTRKSDEHIEQLRVARIDAQIIALEKQAIEQGLIRTIIDDLLIRSLALAAQAGVTEAQLLDHESEHYSRAYEKVHANAAARAALRAQR